MKKKFKDIEFIIKSYYLKFLKREVDDLALKTYKKHLLNGKSLNWFKNIIKSSNEYFIKNIDSFFDNKNINYEFKDKIINHYNNKSKDKIFYNYIKNKKIAIIGPSPSVKKTKNGNFIEKNYDIIIRINKGWKHDISLNEYIGKRTDILYNCLNYSSDCGGIIDINYNLNKLKFIVSPIKYHNNDVNDRDYLYHNNTIIDHYFEFHKNNKNAIPFIKIENKVYDKYDKLANTRINTGLMAIFHILEYPIKELYIKGFSFFLDGYLLNYRNKINNNLCRKETDTIKNVFDFLNKGNNHNIESQWKLFKDVYNKNKNIIKMDDTLKNIVNLDKFPNINCLQ